MKEIKELEQEINELKEINSLKIKKQELKDELKTLRNPFLTNLLKEFRKITNKVLLKEK